MKNSKDQLPSAQRPEWIAFAIIACAAVIGVCLWLFASPVLEDRADESALEAVGQVEVPMPKRMEADQVTRAEVAEAQIAEVPPAGTREVVPATTPANDSVAPDKPKASDIDPNAPLVVRVLDFTGTPVQGVGIEWVVKNPMGPIQGHGVNGVTDAGGRLAIEEARRYLDARFHPTPQTALFASMFGDFGVRCSLPFEEYQSADDTTAPGVHWIDAEPQPGTTIDVTLPPSGWVEFAFEPVIDGRGEELFADFIQIRRSDGEHFPGWRTGIALPHTARTFRFGPVGLGWEVYAELSHHDLFGSLGSVRAPGPTSAGETVTISIPTPASLTQLAWLHGRIVDQTDAPVANRRMSLTFGDPEDKRIYTPSIQTDTGGAWQLHLPIQTLTTVATVFDRGDRRKARGAATLKLNDPDQTVFDLGTIALIPTIGGEVPIVSGYVRDANNQGIQRVMVSVEGQATTLNGKSIRAQPDGTQPWTRLAYQETRKDGSYALNAQAELESPKVRVRVSHADYYPVELSETLVGDTNVDFALQKGSAVTLKVTLEPWVLMTESVALRFAGEGRNNNPSIGDFYGHYESHFGGLTPGTYTFQVELNSEWVLYEQEVAVAEGQTVDLGEIDLSGQLKLCHVAFVDGNGQAIDKQYIQAIESATHKRVDDSARVDKLGHLDLVVPAHAGDVLILGQDGASAIVPASLFLTPEPGTEPARTTITFAN